MLKGDCNDTMQVLQMFKIILNCWCTNFALQPVLLITTGRQSKDQGVYTPLEEASLRLQRKGASVFSLGIGEDVDSTELENVASAPENVFTVDSYGNLDDNVKEIKRSLCIGIDSYTFVPF